MMKRFLLLTICWIFFKGPSAIAQTDGVYLIPHFVFESGATLDGLRVGYTTYGHLNAARSNGVLLLPPTSGGRHWADSQIGPGKAYDTDRYFLISTDAIGTGASSKPSDGLGPKFPAYTIRDMVHAEYAMVTEGLNLTQLLAAAGPSMGSFQALEWGIGYPGFAKGLILIEPTAHNDQGFHAISDAVRATITLDPAYKNGTYTQNPVDGLRRAGAVYFPWLYTDTYLRTLTTEDLYEKQLYSFGDNWARSWDANGLLLRYEASRNHDVSKPFHGDMKAALGRIQAQSLIVVSQTDRLVPRDLSEELRDGLHDPEWEVMPTIRGHMGGALPGPGSSEEHFLATQIRVFLKTLAP
jgi:homoserine O-acetyltransferase/O-succinyltransferase